VRSALEKAIAGADLCLEIVLRAHQRIMFFWAFAAKNFFCALIKAIF